MSPGISNLHTEINPLLVALLEPAMALMYRVERDSIIPGPGTLRGLESHRRILNALADHDPTAAVQAIEAHCQILMELRNQRQPNWEDLKYGLAALQQEVNSKST